MFGNARIFDDIVQQGSHQALVVHVHVGKNGRDGQRMRNISLTGTPGLAFMGCLGEIVGFLDLLYLVFA